MRKLVFILTFVAIGILMAWGVPANNQYVAKRMADGSTVMVRLAGDEFFSYMVTADGRVVKEESGVLVETGKMEADMNYQFVSRQRMKSKLMSENQQRVIATTSSGAFSKGLVIMINFSDQSFTFPKSEYINMLNQQGYNNNGATGSAKDYFVDNSGGQYNPTFDVFGPYTLDHNTAYYGAPTEYDQDIRRAQMALDAVRKLAADTSANVNFSDYDCDNDGTIDNVFIFYAGCGQNYTGNSEDYVWPHRWTVTTSNTDANSKRDLTFGGKLLNVYACTSELAGVLGSTTICGIGVFCHEFSHVLGLMDLYVTDYSSDHKTVGNWDIMCNGNYLNNERTPAGYSTFERFAVGWFNPPVICSSDSYDLDYTLSGHEGYIITRTGAFNYDFDNPEPAEYFVLENRQNESWDSYLPGHGLLIEKIKWNSNKWYGNKPCNDPNNMVVDLIEAGGATDAMGDPSDPFPGIYGISSYSPYGQYPLTNIREVGNRLHFDLQGGAPKGPFTVAFDDRSYGVADTTALKEDAIYAGVTLPNVQANDGYEFVGWCASMTGNSSDILNAGAIYHPKRNTLLFAVYKQNGYVVEDYYGECLTEHFSKLGNSCGINITNSIDAYCDQKGWKGNILESNIGMVKVGNDTTKGYLLTPELGIEGEVEVSFILSQDVRSYFGVETEDGLSAEYPLAMKGPGVVRVSLHDVLPNSKLKFISDVNSFNISDIHFCGDKASSPVATIEKSEEEPVIIRDKVVGGHVRIEGLKEGMRIMIVDGMGRILMTRDAIDDVMEFDAPETIYFIKIL